MRARRHLLVAVGLAWLSLVTVGCRPEAATLSFSPGESPTLAEDRLRVLEQIDAVLSEEYLYPDILGRTWEAELAALREDVTTGLEAQAYVQALTRLLGSLPEGTVSLATREERIAASVGADAFVGIGAFVAFRESPEPRLILLSVVEGSPAETAGLRAHDAILAIDGQPVTPEEGAAAVERIRGPAGGSIGLEVRSPDGGRRTVTVTRQRVVATDEVVGRVMSTGVVHLVLPVRADLTLLDGIDAAMAALAEEPDASGLVLDLRVAGSDGRWPLEEMLTLFVNGDLGGYVLRDGESPLVIRGRDSQGTQAVPLVVLVGRDTSGAPEVFAAAVQSTRRGLVVGQMTAGRVFGFGTTILVDGSQLAYVRSTFTTPLGQDLGAEGVVPNLVVDADWDEVSETRDPVLGTALGLLAP